MSWGSIVALVLTSSTQLRDQRAQYDELTQQLLLLEQVRAVMGEIAAADDEFMMLGAINRIEHTVSREQLQRDHAVDLLSGKKRFMEVFSQLQKLVKTSRPAASSGRTDSWQPFFEGIRSKYYGYMTAAERLNRLAGSQVDMSAIMKILGEAKSYEKSIANDINGRIDHVNFRLGKHHPLFDATINEARDTLLGLMLLAMIPALLTGYLALRGILKMFGEISTNKERIATANQSLESALAELRRVQETMVQTERLSTLGRLTATVSHELRNPMAAIRNSLFLIREFAGQPDKVNVNVERAERSIVRCDNIIGDLLEYTRSRNLNLQPVSLQFMVRTILEEHKLPAKLKLTTDLRGSEAKVMADLDRFRRVVINLVENAAEAIKVHRGFGEIKVQTGLIGNHAFLEISDDGPGMTEEIRGRIFEPLFTTKSFGAGLGLPTAKQLVEQHLGKITVNSEPGVGSSFRVTLPLATAQQGRAA